MPNKIILIVFIFTSIFLETGSSQSLEDRFYPIVCECFEENYSEENFDTKLFEKCFDMSNPESQEIIREYMLRELDSNQSDQSFEDGYKLGKNFAKNLLNDLQEPLVNKCDSYYKFSLQLKKVMQANMSKGVSKKQADSLLTLIESGKRTAETMWRIGSYELGLGSLIKARDYFNKSIKANPNYTQSIFFLGIVNDMEGKYQKACNRYNQLLTMDKDYLNFIVTMFLEVSKRKARE